MSCLYSIAILKVSVVLFPYFLFRLLSERKHRAGLSQRFGFIPRRVLEKRTGKPVIWVHCVSVGEVLAAAPLIKQIRGQFHGYQLLLSTTTVTGQGICRKTVAAPEDLVIYFPVDLPFVVRRVLALFSPRAILLMETEIWPNLIKEEKRREIKLLLVNGRLSDKSFLRYRKLRPFIRPLLRSFSFIGMQTEQGKERMLELGSSKQVACVMGSMKYEAALSSVPSDGEVRTLRMELGIPEKRVIVAGSTHRGEEQLALRAYLELKQRYPDLFLVIAPRHPERFGEVENLLRQNRVPYLLRSAKTAAAPPCAVILLDTLGELMKFYAMATVALVGKSLTQRGGHNPLEPAACARPVLFGRHMENFREVADILLAEGGALRVSNYGELVSAFDSLLGDEAAAKEMGCRARKAVESHTGAVDRAVTRLQQILRVGA